MSNIYIQEPPTSGKVLLKTTVGDIDIELWTRECPKACRNFIQLCMEGYYNNTTFHRVVKGFIVQGGDPNGDGTGGESIWKDPFKDEFHSRLRYTRRGLLGMANADKDDNGSQFFFTMAPTPELQNKNTLFGKVTGDTVFNMLKLEEGLVDHNEKPMYPNKILKVKILTNPFDDIIPREIRKDIKKENKKSKEKGVKNFGLLSFGQEAEEDENEASTFVQKNIGKGKSTHDVLDDPRLSKEPVTIDKESNKDSDIEDYTPSNDTNQIDVKQKAEAIKNKLKSSASKNCEKNYKNNSSSDEDYLKSAEQEKKKERDEKAKQIREEILSLKKQYQTNKKKKDEFLENETQKDSVKKVKNELLKEFQMEQDKYSHLKKNKPKQGESREDFTLGLLSKFRNKLDDLRQNASESDIQNTKDDIIENDIKSDNWLAHSLKFEDNAPTLAKDASTKSDDWYDVFDPRNPINKRKRGEQKNSDSKKIKHD